MALHTPPITRWSPTSWRSGCWSAAPSITGLLDTLQTKMLIERKPIPTIAAASSSPSVVPGERRSNQPSKITIANTTRCSQT